MRTVPLVACLVGLAGLSWPAGPTLAAISPLVTAVLAESALAAWDGTQAQQGTIRGRLEIRRPTRPVDRRPDVAEAGGPPARGVPDMSRGVVYLATAPRGAFDDREPARAVMDQRNETFVPHVLAVQAGAVVDFPNSDRTFHNVFSLSKTKRFDLGRYAAGRSKSVRFDQPGIVRVFCDIHSHMNAFVLVFGHPFYDVTDATGRFQLDNVPAGTYTVVGWYEGEPRATRAITVPAGGSVDLQLVVP